MNYMSLFLPTQQRHRCCLPVTAANLYRIRFLQSTALAVLYMLIFYTAVFAHDENTVLRYGSFLAGFTHPVLGLDHLLAMLSVGIVSAQIGGRAIWTVPATFVGMMAMGGLLGFLAVPMPPIELGIALSVLILGIVIALNWSLPLPIAMIAVSIFAIFHGYAHGAEMPDIANPWRYVAGFLTGTALIHLVGVLIGDIPTRYENQTVTFGILGAIIALCGLLFIIGIL